MKLFSINTAEAEIASILDFLKDFEADVICLLDIPESNFEIVKNSVSKDMLGKFFPIADKMIDKGLIMGDALFVPQNCAIKSYCYYGCHFPLQKHIEGNVIFTNWYFLYATIGKFTIGTTYFIWTPDGKPDEHQRKGLKILLEFLKKNFKEIVFCGDFNAPRGGEIFSAFADRYKDNIPEKYKTSLDSSHKGYGKPWWETTMVDGIFSTPRYIVKNVIFHKGLSDHQAVTAEIFLTDNIKY